MINLGFMGFPNYDISIHGKIFNNTTHREVKPQPESTGYMRVKLYQNGEYKRFRVHVLMAKAFMNPEYSPMIVNHIDGDKTNNDLKNLEIIDQKANVHHAIDNGRRVSLKGRTVYVMVNDVNAYVFTDKKQAENLKKQYGNSSWMIFKKVII